MKRVEGLTKRIIILVLVIAVMVVGVVACGKRTTGTTAGTTYKLTHTAVGDRPVEKVAPQDHDRA